MAEDSAVWRWRKTIAGFPEEKKRRSKAKKLIISLHEENLLNKK